MRMRSNSDTALMYSGDNRDLAVEAFACLKILVGVIIWYHNIVFYTHVNIDPSGIFDKLL